MKRFLTVAAALLLAGPAYAESMLLTKASHIIGDKPDQFIVNLAVESPGRGTATAGINPGYRPEVLAFDLTPTERELCNQDAGRGDDASFDQWRVRLLDAGHDVPVRYVQ